MSDSQAHALLSASVVGFVAAHPGATFREIARGVHARDRDVREAIVFAKLVKVAERGDDGRPVVRHYVAADGPGRAGTGMSASGCSRVLARLRRGPATAAELYALGAVAHSRIAELRRRGYDIVCDRTGRPCDGAASYVYTLVRDRAAA